MERRKDRDTLERRLGTGYGKYGRNKENDRNGVRGRAEAGEKERRNEMIEYKKYFIVGTNDNALHDTMNGNVTGELIQCKECQGYDEGRCHWWYDDPDVPANGHCYQAERKEE